jgi:hypothetical protein
MERDELKRDQLDEEMSQVTRLLMEIEDKWDNASEKQRSLLEKEVEKLDEQYHKLDEQRDALNDKINKEQERIEKEISSKEGIQFLTEILKNTINMKKHETLIIKDKLSIVPWAYLKENIDRLQKKSHRDEYENILLQLFAKENSNRYTREAEMRDQERMEQEIQELRDKDVYVEDEDEEEDDWL